MVVEAGGRGWAWGETVPEQVGYHVVPVREHGPAQKAFEAEARLAQTVDPEHGSARTSSPQPAAPDSVL